MCVCVSACVRARQDTEEIKRSDLVPFDAFKSLLDGDTRLRTGIRAVRVCQEGKSPPVFLLFYHVESFGAHFFGSDQLFQTNTMKSTSQSDWSENWVPLVYSHSVKTATIPKWKNSQDILGAQIQLQVPDMSFQGGFQSEKLITAGQHGGSLRTQWHTRTNFYKFQLKCCRLFFNLV